MICDRCTIERNQSDFLPSHFYCYHCVYEIKKLNLEKKNIPKVLKCRMCKKEIPFEENAKKRQRNVFCSKDCALQGHKELSNGHWTRKALNSQNVVMGDGARFTSQLTPTSKGKHSRQFHILCEGIDD